MTASITRQNHYVPIWYQKCFIPDGNQSLFYLNLNPPKFVLADRRVIIGKSLTPRAPKSCFWSEDLYTTRFGGHLNDDVERRLFGTIDNAGAPAFDAFSRGDMAGMHECFLSFFEYLSAQKLRTPKGLDWIKAQYPSLTQLDLMLEMQSLRRMFCTLWLEGVREIVSAEQSDVKFILTDHPVTVYNSFYPPESAVCRYPNDASVALNGTQTICPLDLNHCLIMTNVAFAKAPDRVNPKETRENARYSGETISRTDALIRTRQLNRDEVISINYLLKSRARQFLAASEKEWLFPEMQESRPWREIGKVLLPPSKELWHFGGEIIIGHTDGSSQYQDEFGRSRSHEHLRKTPPALRLKPNDSCGCGSGRAYKKCCSGVPRSERPPWDVFSIRERNLMFANAVLDILGLNKGKTWTDVRRDLNDEQVKRIHEVLAALWPRDTNVAQLLPRPDIRVDVRKLAEDDFRRSMFRLSDSSLKRLAKDFESDLDSTGIEDVVAYMKSLHAADPLALLQPIDPEGEVYTTRGISLEVALFIAQLTGSAIYTDLDEYWQQLKTHAMAGGTAPDSRCAPIVQGLRTVAFTVEGNPNSIRQIRWSGKWDTTRDAIRRTFNGTRQLGDKPIQRAIIEALAKDVQQSAQKMKKPWRDLDERSEVQSQMRYHLSPSFPEGGFWHRTVQRLLITFGRPKYDRSVWLAIRIKQEIS